jgi:hypothetical protein
MDRAENSSATTLIRKDPISITRTEFRGVYNPVICRDPMTTKKPQGLIKNGRMAARKKGNKERK